MPPCDDECPKAEDIGVLHQDIKHLKHRMQKSEDAHIMINQKVDNLSEQMKALTDILTKIEGTLCQLNEMISAWNIGKGFFTGIGVLGSAIKWVALVGGAIAVLTYFIKTGEWLL